MGFDYPNAKATIYGEGKNKISWIAIKDVASFAVASLDNPAAKNRIIELGGPEALSPLEVVNIFETTKGKKFAASICTGRSIKSTKRRSPGSVK